MQKTQTAEKQEFAVDSFPVAFCQKNRIDQRKLFLSRKYLGYAPLEEKQLSSLSNLFPRYIKARTEAGFLIKVMCSVLAYSISFICKTSLI